ncbi:MAG: hypothetical protein ACYDBZ_03650 [Steroidobacteraceae bacterium]
MGIEVFSIRTSWVGAEGGTVPAVAHAAINNETPLILLDIATSGQSKPRQYTRCDRILTLMIGDAPLITASRTGAGRPAIFAG